MIDLRTTSTSDPQPRLEIQIVPNPASDRAQVLVSGARPEQVLMFDMLGKRIPNCCVLSGNTIELELSHLSSGIYLIGIETNRGTVSKKLVVQH